MSTSATPAARIEALIKLTERLTTLLAAQAKAFEARRPQDAARHMDEVSRLANVYRHESSALHENPVILTVCPEPLRARLARTVEAFDAVLARHGRALHAAKTITEGLVRAVAEEISAQRNQGASYGPTARPKTTPAASITLNKRA